MQIKVLDQITIDKIAAGEVVERPASIVKELVENAIDAGAGAIIAEIEEGGISMIRITDNGMGIDSSEIQKAFLRHSTSKITHVDDLQTLHTLGFRGEALSSISAVSKVELITKTKEALSGSRYLIEGGKEVLLEEVGAPEGTTFLIRQLFYNTPARRKFLKTPMTEASHISDLLTRLALSHPEIAFQFISNGQTKIHTSGNGKLKDVIYHIYGREAAANLLELDFEKSGLKIEGYIGKPSITRGNRSYENYFVNGRYVKNNTIAKAIEDAYKDFSMQHKYPFVVLHFTLSGEDVDVNVHPSKMEMRFRRQQEIYNVIYEAVNGRLAEKEMIPVVEVPEAKIPYATDTRKPELSKEELREIESEKNAPKDLQYFVEKMKDRVSSYHNQHSVAEVPASNELYQPNTQIPRIKEAVSYAAMPNTDVHADIDTPSNTKEPVQQNFFEEGLLKKDTKSEHRLIGQVFGTYWMIEYRESLYIIDQHAAHERVMYEKLLRDMRNKSFTSQYINPPIVLELTMKESQALEKHIQHFTNLGFEIEAFGGESYTVRAIPANLFGLAKKELLLEMIDDFTGDITPNITTTSIDEKIASMSCKAAIKGNSKISSQEMSALIGELLELENPYHCPHGRPTIIAMTKRELEKKFKRIV